MSEFNVGDRVRRTKPHEDIGQKMQVGDIGTVNGTSGRYGVELEEFSAFHDRRSLELVTPEYRHGDVYEHKEYETVDITITKNGLGSTSTKGDKHLHRNAAGYNGGRDPAKECGKFLYNVFDKESADSDCAKDELTDLIVPLEEDNTKEAIIMPLTIVKTTTQELPNGEPVDKYRVNGTDFGHIDDKEAVNLIREANAEIKALRLDAKDSGSKRILKDAGDLTAVRKVLVNLLDDRD